MKRPTFLIASFLTAPVGVLLVFKSRSAPSFSNMSMMPLLLQLLFIAVFLLSGFVMLTISSLIKEKFPNLILASFCFNCLVVAITITLIIR